jgi:hypothetical protein
LVCAWFIAFFSEAGNITVELGFFYRELSAAGDYNWPPAPLGWKLTDARTRKQPRTTEIGPSFSFMMYISFAAQIHRSTITTVARPQLAGSREPATKAK